MIVTIKHVRAKKYCMSGVRKFFERYGLDWSDFVRNGIDAQKLLDTKDAMAQRVVEHARLNQ